MLGQEGWLRLHVANICNFNCPHCHVFKISENSQPAKIMSPQIFRESVKSYIGNLENLGVKKLTINLYGGEPLLARKFLFDEILNVEETYKDLIINWQIISNGSLLDTQDISFFKRLRNFEFHLSLDGPEDIQTKTRPMKNLKNSFKEALRALKLLAEFNIKTQLNSYLMPENMSSLHFLVDVAKEHGIKKIYLDILHSPDYFDLDFYLEKYLQVMAYGRSRGINISGPWRNIKSNHNGKSHLEARRLGIDVLNDGRFFSSAFPLEKRTAFPLSALNDHMSAMTMTRRFKNYTSYFHKSCQNCALENQCQGGAISQFHYHVGREQESYAICDFFRKFVPIVSPQFTLYQDKRLSILSQVKSKKRNEIFLEKVQDHLNYLDRKFVRQPHILFFIFKSQLGLKFYTNAFHFPKWTKSFSGKQNQIYQVGLGDGIHLRHELSHVYLNEMGADIPSWLQEGLCEYLARGPFSPKFLTKELSQPLNEWVAFCTSTKVLITINDKNPEFNLEYKKAHLVVSQMVEIYSWGEVLQIAELSSKIGFQNAIEMMFKKSLPSFLNSIFLLFNPRACELENEIEGLF